MSQEKIKSSELGKLKPHPILKDLPDELKTVEAFKEIQSKILLIMVSDHKHRKVERFATCKKCSAKRNKRNEYILSKGFKNYGQYLEWRKIMDIIINEKDFRVS